MSPKSSARPGVVTGFTRIGTSEVSVLLVGSDGGAGSFGAAGRSGSKSRIVAVRRGDFECIATARGCAVVAWLVNQDRPILYLMS